MSNNVIPIIPTPQRTCGECTACCDGWLHGEAYGHNFYRGKPCFYVHKGCTIYQDRPSTPCKSYKCTWLEEDILPMWMRPDLCGVILSKREFEGIPFYFVTEMEEPIKANVLNHLIQLALNSSVNLEYTVDGGPNRIGTAEYIAARNKQILEGENK